MSLSQDKLASNFTTTCHQISPTHWTNTQLFYKQKKGYQTSLIFFGFPPPHFLPHFCYFLKHHFCCAIFLSKKKSSKVQRCVATNFQKVSIDPTWNHRFVSTVISPGWTTSCPPPRRACGTWISRGIWSDSCSTNRGSLGVVVFWGLKI